MIRRLLHASAGAILGGCAGAVTVVLAYAWAPGLALEMNHDRPGLLSGVYRGERTDGRTFAWTTARADLRLAGLDRHVRWTVRVHARGARQDPARLPDLTILADGIPIRTEPTSNEYQAYTATIPTRRDGRRGLVLSIASSDTFVPGPGDRRSLGVQIDRIEVAPERRSVLAPLGTVVMAAFMAAVFGAVFGLLSATALTAVAAAVLLAVAQAGVITLGTGPYAADWLGTATRLAAVIALALPVLAAVLARARGERLRNTALFALLFSAATLHLKLLVLLHPDKRLVDALFHVHRLQDVMAGNLYFTSIAPGGYRFPYPVGLYVAAIPFTAWVADRVELLRVLVATADVASVGLLYWAVVRAWGDRLAAAATVGIAQWMPLGFMVQGSANLTNAFGQAVALTGLVLILARPAHSGVPSPRRARVPRGVWSAVTFVVLLWALLSHTSTFATLSAITVAAGLLVLVAARPDERPYGRWILVMGLAAAVVAIAVYYAHFLPTYRSELARIRAEVSGGPGVETPASPALYQPGGASIPSRLRAVPATAVHTWTAGFLVLAGVGLVAWTRRFGRSARWLVLLGWLAGCGALLGLGILTPVDFRHFYAAQPAVAMLAGAGLATLWRRAGAWRWAGAALAGWGLAAGIGRSLDVLLVSL